MTMCVSAVLIGADMDPHRWIHDSFWRHVCQDVEGARHFQECEDEEEGIELYIILYNELRDILFIAVRFDYIKFDCLNYTAYILVI